MTDILSEGWAITTLNDVAAIDMGQSPHGAATNSDGIGLPLIGGASDLGEVYPKPTRHTSSPSKVCKNGDLLLCIRATIGKVNVADQPYCLGRGVAGIRPIGIEPKWINYLFQKDEEKLNAAGTGSTFRQVNKRTLSLWPVPIPPKAEQVRIIKKIDALMERSANANELLAAIPAMLDQYHQSTLAAAFRGDLTSPWRKQNPNVAPVKWDDTNNSESDLFATFENTKTHTIPETWAWIRLKDLGSITGGGTPRKDSLDYWNGSIPWVSPKDMKLDFIEKSQDTITELGLVNSSAKLVAENSVLFVVRGMILAHSFPVAINTMPVTINQDMKAISLNDMCDSRFLLYALQNLRRIVVSLTASSTHGTKRLESTRLLNLAIPIPPLDEQHLIVEHLENTMSRLDVATTKYNEAVGSLDALNQSILAKAFKGDLVPQSPDDEPADALLERIRAEREGREKAKAKKKGPRKMPQQKHKRKIISITEALEQASIPLSAQDLLAQAGYPNDVATEQLETFFLEIRELLSEGTITRNRMGDEDIFALVG